MEIAFEKVSAFPRGTRARLLREAYAFEPLYEKLYAEVWRQNDEFFFEHPDIADRYGLITTLDGEPIGHIAWDPRHLPQYAEIGDNCIIPACRGRGYGKLQLLETLRRICLHEVHKIIVTTNRGLTPARRNYESVGFTAARAYAGGDGFEHIDYEIIIRPDTLSAPL